MATDSQDGVYKTFDSMGLKEELLRGVFSYGFESPSAIQERAIVPITKGKDIIAQAQSGTGKTGTFAIGTLQRINPEERTTQAIILAPSRELALQIHKVVSALGEKMGARVHVCVGGTDVRQDMEALRSGIHIVVGTPGRVFDMINKGVLKLGKLKVFVLDEADQMLDRGFKDQIYEIFSAGLPNDVQIVLVSATMPADALELTEKFMRDPVRILVKKEELTLDGIKQYKVELTKEEQKLEVLADIYGRVDITQSIIYCNTRTRVEHLASELKKQNFVVSCIHGDMAMNEREQVMKEFRSGATRILITTDLLARGIDIQQLSIVINYDLPKDRENYIHRIGRSGRYGKKGVGINLVASELERNLLRDIETFYNTTIADMPDLDAAFAM